MVILLVYKQLAKHHSYSWEFMIRHVTPPLNIHKRVPSYSIISAHLLKCPLLIREYLQYWHRVLARPCNAQVGNTPYSYFRVYIYIVKILHILLYGWNLGNYNACTSGARLNPGVFIYLIDRLKICLIGSQGSY